MSVNKRRLLIAISIPLTMAMLVVAAGFLGIRLNIASNSLPYGLYRVVPEGQGKDVLFCPTGAIETMTIERGYRPKALGCNDGYAPLLKPISAHAGDQIEISETGISVNNKLLPNSKQFKTDGHGRALPHMPYGKYTVEPGTIWVVSTYNRYSFDSRYFGPVSLHGKVKYATPLWIF
jgi:conjugative transfer signal peptidase TraF